MLYGFEFSFFFLISNLFQNNKTEAQNISFIIFQLTFHCVLSFCEQNISTIINVMIIEAQFEFVVLC